MAWIALAIEAVKIISNLVGWWVKLDDETRKQIRDAHGKLLEAEKNGKQAGIRSAVNRLNASL